MREFEHGERVTLSAGEIDNATTKTRGHVRGAAGRVIRGRHRAHAEDGTPTGEECVLVRSELEGGKRDGAVLQVPVRHVRQRSRVFGNATAAARATWDRVFGEKART